MLGQSSGVARGIRRHRGIKKDLEVAAPRGDEPQSHDHAIVDDIRLERMLRVELTPEEYDKLLCADLSWRFAEVCPHVLDNLVSLEALRHRAIGSEFSFWAPTDQLLQKPMLRLGEFVRRDGREASDKHVEVVAAVPWCQRREDHCKPQYAVGLHRVTRYCKKGAEWPMDAAALRAIALNKKT